LRGKRQGDARNQALFLAIGPSARKIYQAKGTREELLQLARRLNAECAEPMEDIEVERIVESVWGMTLQDRNFIGRAGVWVDAADLERMARDDHDSFVLLAFLRARNSGTFMVANGLAPCLGMGEKRLAHARDRLLGLGYLIRVSNAGRGHAARFRFGYPY